MTQDACETWLCMALQSRLEGVRVAAIAVRELCKSYGLSDNLQHDLELCLVESLTNIVKHSYKGETTHVMELSLRFCKDVIVCTLTDFGESNFSLEEELQGCDTLDPDTPPENGLGLLIPRSITSSLEYTAGPDRNTLVFTIPVGEKGDIMPTE